MIKDELNYLLFYVPEHADYAVDSTELDPEDIAEDRVSKLQQIVSIDIDCVCDSGGVPDIYEHFTTARILSSWGYESGFDVLSQYIFREDLMEGQCFMQHRLRLYNDVYQHALMGVRSFFSMKQDAGSAGEYYPAVEKVVFKILDYAKSKPFEPTHAFSFIRREKKVDFESKFKEYLAAIIDDIDTHRWKIYDTLRLVNEYDPDFVQSLLKSRDKRINDYDLGRDQTSGA